MSSHPLRRLVGRLAPYRWPVLALLAWLALALLAFGPGFVGKVFGRLSSEDWWAENILVFAIFSGLTTWLVSLAQRDRERRWRRHFEGWRMEMVEGGKVIESTNLHWEDAEKYLNSEFERWRAIKAMLSTPYDVRALSIVTAREGGWLDDPMASLAACSSSDEGWLEPPDGWSRKTIRILVDKAVETRGIERKAPRSAPT